MRTLGRHDFRQLCDVRRNPPRLVALKLNTNELIKSPGSIVPPGECHDVARELRREEHAEPKYIRLIPNRRQPAQRLKKTLDNLCL
jgi:hypothetical protein